MLRLLPLLLPQKFIKDQLFFVPTAAPASMHQQRRMSRGKTERALRRYTKKGGG